MIVRYALKVRKIFIGPIEICGIARELSMGFSELGIESSVILSEEHPFDYGKTKNVWLVKWWRGIAAKASKPAKSQLLTKIFFYILQSILAWGVLAYSIVKFDAFIFIFNRTITNTRIELILLKFFRKKIIFICLGSDARPPFINGSRFTPSSKEPDFFRAKKLALSCKRTIRLHERYADYVVNAPGTAQFQEAPFINWFSMGIPKSLPVQKESIGFKSSAIRVLHSPSNSLAKGTAEIVETIERLKGKGYSIDFIKIENMPNEVVLKELSQCDFIVDQLYSDTPMAVFATEAALHGKPAVVGGYFANDIENYLEVKDMPPSLYVLPDDLEAAIEKLIVDKDFREALGKKAKKFVENHWAPKVVAGRYLQLISDDVPNEWWCDPYAITYTNGFAMPSEYAARLIYGMVGQFGVESLQLMDKPYLERFFLKMVEPMDRKSIGI